MTEINRTIKVVKIKDIEPLPQPTCEVVFIIDKGLTFITDVMKTIRTSHLIYVQPIYTVPVEEVPDFNHQDIWSVVVDNTSKVALLNPYYIKDWEALVSCMMKELYDLDENFKHSIIK